MGNLAWNAVDSPYLSSMLPEERNIDGRRAGRAIEIYDDAEWDCEAIICMRCPEHEFRVIAQSAVLDAPVVEEDLREILSGDRSRKLLSLSIVAMDAAWLFPNTASMLVECTNPV